MATVDKTRSQPPPRGPHLVRAPWHGTSNAGDVFCRADFPCLRNRCFRALTPMAGLKPCATENRDGR